MEIASAVFEHNFDKAMLDQIDTLRTIRLNMAERMLQNLEATTMELTKRGLVEGDLDSNEVKRELTERITTLRERIQRPDIIYSDEISLYVDLIEDNNASAE